MGGYLDICQDVERALEIYDYPSVRRILNGCQEIAGTFLKIVQKREQCLEAEKLLQAGKRVTELHKDPERARFYKVGADFYLTVRYCSDFPTATFC